MPDSSLTLVFRKPHAHHFGLDADLYSRTDAGEWFLAYDVGVWQPIQDPAELARLEKLFLDWNTPPRTDSMLFELHEFDEPIRETTDEES